MILSLRNSASGINSLQARIDATASNIEGINTTAFKKERISFADLMYKKLTDSGRPVVPEQNSSVAGLGVRQLVMTRVSSQGNIIETDRKTDLAINGNGFFKILLPDGESVYTRNGSFNISSNGELVTSDGYLVYPEIILPENYSELTIQQDGKVKVRMPDSTIADVGEIPLYSFVNPDELRPLGKSLYASSMESGDEEEGIPGAAGFGLIEQSSLESSNVELSEEMTDLIESQRAFQLNSRALRVSDELWSMANNLRKY
ncbi:MAG: flagellar basal-body rod protein FlgG [Peptococcaceae bacterium]|nr:flagellar basal-body rod protein FlgG [Peptococcaceae bacterium]